MSAGEWLRDLGVLSLVVLIGVLVAGCSSSQSVVQTGSGTDDFKISPCACGPEIPQPGLERYRRQVDAHRA